VIRVQGDLFAGAVPPAAHASRLDGPASSRLAEARVRHDLRAGTERARVLALLRECPFSTAAELHALSELPIRDGAVGVRRHLWHLAQHGLAEVTDERACEIAGTLAQTWRATR